MTKVCIELCNGKKMIVKLYDEVAPKTVAHFLKLVDNHFYDGTIFHRIINGFMSQGGGFIVEDKSLKLRGAPNVEGEFEANGFRNSLHHELGVISMARTQDFNSGSSQFFLCDANCSFLDGQYAAFGAIDDFDSVKTLVELNSVPTTKLAGNFDDFPAVENIEDITIKTISRF